MNKTELSNLLHSCCDAVNEWVSSKENERKSTRIVYWGYVDEDINASGTDYEEKRTYQISIYSDVPECDAYKTLRKKLRDMELHPVFYHEYIEQDKIFHTYFALEVIE